MMRSRFTIVPSAVAALLAVGCQNAPPAAIDESVSQTALDPAIASAAERTATLWVKGMGCPF